MATTWRCDDGEGGEYSLALEPFRLRLARCERGRLAGQWLLRCLPWFVDAPLGPELAAAQGRAVGLVREKVGGLVADLEEIEGGTHAA